jgi:Phage tail sheath C-terminal domain
VALIRATSTVDGSTAVVNATISIGDAVEETFNNLTMDPDDERYLPAVFESSALVRALDLFVRSRMTSIPRNMARAASFTNGTSPLVDDYQAALDRLETAEPVDLVIASCANQLDDAGVIAAQQAVIAHCEKMATVARNRIGRGSVTASESGNPSLILSHADDTRSDHFVLTTPAGSEAAIAGLLSRQDYFQSPTFKTVASLGVTPGAYTDAQLRQLITGNVLVVNKKRGLGIIVMKGLLTSGRQINVQRTANKAVRDVKAICDKYIGLLNNEGARIALRQQITALFLQMERDGAIVPSTDGTQPSFAVDVYSTQADFANGIVRVDLAIRPVRAIDFIYATILVQN